mgnify:FL=1
MNIIRRNIYQHTRRGSIIPAAFINKYYTSSSSTISSRLFTTTTFTNNNNNTIAYQYIHGDENIYNKDNKRNTCVMIHGMLGQGKNLRTFARRIVKQYPFFDVLLVDLRGHGKSPSFFPNAIKNNVENCAIDIYNLFKVIEVAPDVIIGHSFGGKVALSLMKHTLLNSDGNAYQILPRTWIWDSVAGTIDPSTLPTKNSTLQVLKALQNIKVPVKSKNVLSTFEKYDIGPGIANWMTTNLVPNPEKPGTYLWAFDLPCCVELFESYCETDIYDVIDELPLIDSFPNANEAPILNFVRAGGNLIWDEDRVTEMDDICSSAYGNQVSIYDVPDVGHWIHVEAPNIVFDLLDQNTLSKFD